MTANSPRALYALVALALLATIIVAMPPASADTVNGVAYHVGDNRLANLSSAQNVDATFDPRLAADGNDSSQATLFSVGFLTGTSNACGGGGNKNATFNVDPTRLDLTRFRYTASIGGNGVNSGVCTGYGLILDDNSVIAIKPMAQDCGTNNCAVTIDHWRNFTLPLRNVTRIYIAAGATNIGSGTYTLTLALNEVEGYDKNATQSDPVLALAHQAAAGLQCLATGAAASNFASHAYTAPSGTFYVLVPTVMPASSTSAPNPMQVYTTASGVTTTFHGTSRVVPDVTGLRSGAVAVWKVTTPQPGIPLYLKPTGTGNINATDTVCAFSRVGAIASSTLTNGYVTAPLTAWGGTANELWGIVHLANGYPVQPAYDVDLSGTGSLFLADNMTFGPQAFANGTVGLSTTILVAALPPFARAGNAHLVAIGQSMSGQGDSANFGLIINGYPAQAVMNGQSLTNAYEYAVFLLDDVALRNNLANTEGTIGQSPHRPLGAELYEIKLGSGYDPTLPVYFGNTVGRDGHASLSCLTICSSNFYASSFILPTQQHNHVDFTVKGQDGKPIPDVRILRVNDSTAKMTDAQGRARFEDWFTNAGFTLTKSGYGQLCAEYRFRNSPGTITGTSSGACPFVAAYNATFEVTMLTLHELNAGSEGIGFVGGTIDQPPKITFEGNTTRYIPDRLNINISRSQGAALFVGLDRVEPTTGVVQHNALRATYWNAAEANTFAFYYPNRARSSSQDAGLFLLWVMNETGVILAHQKLFILANATTIATYDATVGEDWLRATREQGYVSAQQTFQTQFQASLLLAQKSVRDQVYEDFRRISDYGGFLIAFLIFLATVRAFRR